jgi:hypothetical protein
MALNTNFNSLGTSFYPVGMGKYGNRLNQGGYKTWKGDGINKNPVGIAPGHIRPLTNKDPGNVFPSPFGKARPIKHYRKGSVISELLNRQKAMDLNVDDSNQNINNDLIQAEIDQIAYNVNRQVKSSLGTPLGQGRDGGGLLSELMDKPGAYTIKQNTTEDTFDLDRDCKTCQGVGVISSYYPNQFYLTENPEPNVENKKFCCNEERKALRRVVYASTNLKPNYYSTHFQYLQNRCQTHQQKSFNFEPPTIEQKLANTYLANCQPNAEIYQASETDLVYSILTLLVNAKHISPTEYDTFTKTYANVRLETLASFLKTVDNAAAAIETFSNIINNPYIGIEPLTQSLKGCKLTVYKPNNQQFAVQGAVQSSTRNLKLNVTTIETNAASFNNKNILYKNKASHCGNPPICPFQNQRICNYKRLPTYNVPNVQPSPYRYYMGTIFSTNHFSQSPKVAIYTTTRSSTRQF